MCSIWEVKFRWRCYENSEWDGIVGGCLFYECGGMVVRVDVELVCCY